MTVFWVFQNWGEVAEAAIAVGALAAIIVAWLQLGAMKRSQQASVLDELDSKWLSDPVSKAREVFKNLWKDAPEQDVENWFYDRLKNLVSSSPEEYHRLTQLCDYFENLGYMQSKKYIEFKDIYELYGGPLIHAEKVFKKHIMERRKRENDNKLWQHFLAVAKKCRERYLN